tara:strand:+ start:188 stop:439 length:252 start_codon:yes stop_codon:yes gene_type:complete
VVFLLSNPKLKKITQYFSKVLILSDLIAFLYLITMADQKPLFKTPYNIRDVSALFAIVAFVLVIAAIFGNNLFGIFQESVNFG